LRATLRRLTSAAGRSRRRTRLAAATGLAGACSLILASGALANAFGPKSGGSPNADSIHTLYTIILYIAIVVFIVVEGVLLYSVWKFRAKKGAIAQQIHGNTRLEISWTLGAAGVLVILAAVTFIKLPSIINPPNSGANGLVLSASLSTPNPPNGKKLVVCIQGRQYIWRYVYGNGCRYNAWHDQLPYSYQEMVVPENTTVVLDIQSTDVIHSWWIPSLGGKVDAVPGFTTYTWFKASHPALYHGQCAQLCGADHAAMTALVKVVTPEQYTAWLAQQKANIAAANDQVTQLRAELTASGNI
jgi:cytochrome c oxidase subunit 2